MFLRFLLIFIAILLLPDLYIYAFYVARATQHTALRIAYWLPSLVLLVCLLVLLLPHGINGMANHPTAFSRIVSLIFLLTIPKLVFVVSSLVVSLIAFLLRLHCSLFVVHCSLAAVAFLAILYGLTLGVTHFQVKEVAYSSADLPPSFDGLRAVQISDLHAAGWHGRERALCRLIDRINSLQPDVIFFTGDLVNQQSSELDGLEDLLRLLHAPHGIYSILGNHDYGTYYAWPSRQAERDNLQQLIRRERAMGWKLLLNEHDLLDIGGDTIAIIGVENDGEPPFSQMADLPRAARGTEGYFRILLTHNPTHWRREVVPTTDINLSLSGHTHAMQVKLFGWSPAKWKYPEWGGLYTQGDQTLYVNIGLGCAGFPFRLGARPEITLLTLHAGQ